MNYVLMDKLEFQKMKRLRLGGFDGTLYITPDYTRILKLLKNFAFYGGIDGKKVLLSYLIKQHELDSYVAIPKELIYVPCKEQIGYFMTYFKSGVRLDKWCKGKDYGTVLKMFEMISKILKLLHEKYGIVVSDCYYTNILIVDNEFPIFVDVDSFSMEGVKSYTISNMLYHYSKQQYWNRYQQALYLRESKDSDNAALWLMFLECALELPVRKKILKRFSTYLKSRQDITPVIKEITSLISVPELGEVPYLHEVSKVNQLKKCS